ncbi:MAG TPA: transcription elongation factor GreB [Gammaproteobacteria bacterium]|jgi:transcription elongation factor GreB
MGRWRPPPPESSPHITPAGFRALQLELDGLWAKRRDVTRHLAAAAAEGDRSENAEYIYRKKELREIDRRIRYLQKRLPELQIVNAPPANRHQVFFGASVTLESETGVENRYRIVGADEFNPGRNWISIDSPLARALLRKTMGEDVIVTTPAGKTCYSIIDVSYHSAED